MAHHRTAAAAAAATAVVLALLAGCSSGSDSAPTPSGAPAGATTIAPPTSSASASSSSTAPPGSDAPGTSVVPSDAPGTSSPETSADATDGTAPGGTETTVSERTCVAPDTTPVSSSRVSPDQPQDWNVTSFDGTVIRAHWFPLPGLADDLTAPTVMMGPGWGQGGDTDTEARGDGVTIASLRDAGFNVLTWDPRGFGASTGQIEVDSPDHEGRDVSQLIDWLASQPEVELDADRDPRLGMVGGSYGGGIQLVTAARDCRIDAIVPIIAWHSLQTSLFKANTPKTGWADLLYGIAAGRSMDPVLVRSHEAGASGVVDPADVQWFADRGPGDLVDDITVPTLILQGTVDTLFTLDEGATNFERISANGVPAAMLWFCGGHGACLTPAGDTTRARDAAIAWLRHYVDGDDTVVLPPTFEFVDQDGVGYTADGFPEDTGASVYGTGAGTLNLVADGGAGPSAPIEGGLGVFVAPITPTRAANAVDVTVNSGEADADTVIVGAPHLVATYSGTVADGMAPTRVFAQLVDDTTNLVLGNQITPIEVTLDGRQHVLDVPLEMIAFALHPGSTVTLQIVATTTAYATPRLGGSIEFTDVEIDLPVATNVTTR